MKISLYAAISIDGFIAKKDGDSNWVSEIDTKIFFKKIAERGCLVMGNKTFTQYEKEIYPVKDALNIVLTNENNKTSTYQNVVYCASPDEAMRKAREKGCSEILLVGGARTNSSFLKESLIDEIFLTVHPLTFGAGISLFGGAEKQLSLKLLNQELLGEGLIQLHYKVEK